MRHTTQLLSGSSIHWTAKLFLETSRVIRKKEESTREEQKVITSVSWTHTHTHTQTLTLNTIGPHNCFLFGQIAKKIKSETKLTFLVLLLLLFFFQQQQQCTPLVANLIDSSRTLPNELKHINFALSS